MFNEPVDTDVPVLVLAGRHDPVTPPADGQATAAALAQATFVEIDAIVHAVIFSDDCGNSIYKAFLADPLSEVDVSCAESHPGPAFVTG